MEEAIESALESFPNIDCLKDEQKKCIAALLQKKDVFGLLPTGFGKCLIFQLYPRIFIFLFPSSRASRSCHAPREISRSPRLAHKAPVMQAIFQQRLNRGCKQVQLEKPVFLELTYFAHSCFSVYWWFLLASSLKRLICGFQWCQEVRHDLLKKLL